MSKSLYKPKHLEKLSHEIKEKIESVKDIPVQETHSAKLSVIILQSVTSDKSISNLVPFLKKEKKANIEASTQAKESPVLIFNKGIFGPVYLTHLSDFTSPGHSPVHSTHCPIYLSF